MRVLHVITGLGEGGAEGVLARLIEADQTNSHTVVSLTTLGKYGPQMMTNGVRVVALGLHPGSLRVDKCMPLRLLFSQSQFHVVQTWMYHADLVGGLTARLFAHYKVPVVWGIRHSSLCFGRDKLATIMLARMLALISHVVPDRIAVCSQNAAKIHASMGYDRSKMRVIPNGYNLKALQGVGKSGLAWRAARGIAPEAPIIGMVARYSVQKDHVTCIEAFAQLRSKYPNAQLVFAGTGMTESNHVIMRQLQDRQLVGNVHLVGSVPHVAELMHALDIHVLSSSHGEAFPNVLAEAMACGTPCVATDVGDAAMIVGQTGWIVPPRDVARLATAMLESVEAKANGAWSQRRDAASQRIARNFDITGMVAAYNAVWRDAIGARS